MATAKIQKTEVELSGNYRVEYERKKILGGLISWYVKVSSEKIGTDLFINTSEKYDNIFINGIKVNKV